MSNKMVDDTVCINVWRDFLSKFNKIVEGEPAPDKVKKDLEKLIEEAKIDKALNSRQTESIIARCRNYINGQYGNTKTTANMSHSKTS